MLAAICLKMQISCLGKLRAVWPPHPHAASAHMQPACAVSGIQGLVDFTGRKGRNEAEIIAEGKKTNQFELHTSVKSQIQRTLRENIVLRGASVSTVDFIWKKEKNKTKQKINLPLLNHIVHKWLKTKLLPMWSVFYWLLWSDASHKHKLQHNMQCTYLGILLIKMPQWTGEFDNVNHVSLTQWQAFYFILFFLTILLLGFLFGWVLGFFGVFLIKPNCIFTAKVLL